MSETKVLEVLYNAINNEDIRFNPMETEEVRKAEQDLYNAIEKLCPDVATINDIYADYFGAAINKNREIGFYTGFKTALGLLMQRF